MPFDREIGPLFILGALRSGTTQMLRAATELLGYAGGAEGHVWQSVKTLDTHFRTTIDTLGGEETKGIDEFSVIRFSRKDIITAYSQLLLDLHRHTYGDAPLVDKTPGVDMIAAAPLIKQIFPSAKFIFMKRRGIENISSFQRRFPNKPFAAACRNWAASMQQWLETRERLAGDCIEIEQRDLSMAPLEIAERVTNLIGHGDPIALADYFATHFPEKTQLGGYERAVALADTGWSEEYQRQFREMCSYLMPLYGYDIDEGSGPAGAAPGIDIVASARSGKWSVHNGNRWIDAGGPGIHLHPNEPGRKPATLRLDERMEAGQYAFDAEILVFDARCNPHKIALAIVSRGTVRSWSIDIDGAKLGRLHWSLPIFEIDDAFTIEIRVSLDRTASASSYSATHLTSAVLTPACRDGRLVAADSGQSDDRR